MKINDVEKITGLTAKAIRLYESKGLIVVSREENGYRFYTDKDVDALKKIKLFRSVGISISDIKLYLSGVVTIDELLDKRMAEILSESGKNSEKYRICESIASKSPLDQLENGIDFTESERENRGPRGSLSVGIDIGTTTISAAIYDIDAREQVEAYTLPHGSYTKTGAFSEQSVSVIMEKSKKLLFHILDSYEKIVSIGITGQMHGIVYINEDASPVSSLINWQDKRADIMLDGGKTACGLIHDITGEMVYTGYGIATHYYNMITGNVPSGATGFCTIMDLLAMDICNYKAPVVHPSLCASLGLFDTRKNCFMADKISLLGIDPAILPNVSEGSVMVGKCRGIPVSVPIGDNQASFLGSVGKNKSSMLVNIGTGSQISYVSDEYLEVDKDLEVRPFIEGKYLVCGSALCGGFAYSMLEEFFRSYTVSLGLSEESQYSIMNRLAENAFKNGEEGLFVDAYFCGKRSDPQKRGSINMIDRYSFTPSALILGVLKGMCNELYELYERVPSKKAHIVASGGATKRSSVLNDIISSRFGMSVSSCLTEEAAATGAALFSAFVVGKIKYKDGFGKYIREI